MIERFFKSTFTVYRQEWIVETVGDDEIDKSAEVEQDTFKGQLQQANAQIALSLGLTTTKTYTIWCPLDTDVKDGDMLVSGTQKFTVRGKQWNQNGRNNHLELIVEKLGDDIAVTS